ncbi:MAG: tyrosine-type recombinase/integrase [Solirubrobacterales bacterium]
MTLIDLGAEWLDSEHAQSISSSSLQIYSGVIEKHVMRWIGNARIEYVDAAFVKEWQRDLARAGVTPDPRSRALKYLKMLLNFAVEQGYLQGNPASVVKPPKIPASDPKKVLSPRQIESLIAELEIPRDRLLCRLMAYAGLRPIEARSLPWRSVQQRSLIVRSTKTNRVDTVRVWDFLIEDLEAWRAESRPSKRDGPVFPSPSGGIGTRTDYNNWTRRVFSAAAVRAGHGETTHRKTPRRTIPVHRATITPYTLRHSFASMLLRSGMQPVDVAARMRHNVETTLKDYAHVINDLDPMEPLTLPDAILQERELVINGHVATV